MNRAGNVHRAQILNGFAPLTVSSSDKILIDKLTSVWQSATMYVKLRCNTVHNKQALCSDELIINTCIMEHILSAEALLTITGKKELMQSLSSGVKLEIKCDVK